MSCGVDRRHGSDPMLLWLWCRLAATAPIRPLVWEPPYAVGSGLRKGKKTKKKKKKKKRNTHDGRISYNIFDLLAQLMLYPVSRVNINHCQCCWVQLFCAYMILPSSFFSKKSCLKIKRKKITFYSSFPFLTLNSFPCWSGIRVVPLLTSMDQRWHIIINHDPQCTLLSALGGLTPCGL